MSASFQPSAEFDRYLLVDDTDDDVTALLTVIAETTRCSRHPASGDLTFRGGAE